jgi:hypothetical protein
MKNKYDSEKLWTSQLSNNTISRPPQSHETIRLSTQGTEK